jgi:hypothetical protein
VLLPCPLQRADLGWVQELAEPLRGWASELVRLWSILYRRVRRRRVWALGVRGCRLARRRS